jgi:hypothetical protein
MNEGGFSFFYSFNFYWLNKNPSKKLGIKYFDGGLGRTRTGMSSRTADFESTASTDFATRPKTLYLTKQIILAFPNIF